MKMTSMLVIWTRVTAELASDLTIRMLSVISVSTAQVALQCLRMELNAMVSLH